MILSDYAGEFESVRKTKKMNYVKAFAYWRGVLLERCMRIFIWDGLPKELPQKEIELRLFLKGFTGFLKNNGEYLVSFGAMSGVTRYSDIFTLFTFANPKESGMRRIGKDCVIIDNNQIRNPLIFLIERYANLLAHADLSLQAILINSRATGMVAVKDNKQAESVKQWYNALEDGKTMAIVDDVSFNSLLNSEGLRQIATQYPSSKDIGEHYTIIQNLLKSFYNEIGVKMSTEKRERLIIDEVNADNNMLLCNINDMLNCRKHACEEINRIFNLNVSVKLNEEFEPINTTEESEE